MKVIVAKLFGFVASMASAMIVFGNTEVVIPPYTLLFSIPIMAYCLHYLYDNTFN